MTFNRILEEDDNLKQPLVFEGDRGHVGSIHHVLRAARFELRRRDVVGQCRRSSPHTSACRRSLCRDDRQAMGPGGAQDGIGDFDALGRRYDPE